ncbi:uncharacterized protein LOC129249827 isoform X3 [Anastrepha obliqua]|uniref:uncharacterized protein LOC129249827 isoform X3 n=1 Tax=Anastrepha obliqua TaxID=95512 RepID=UPI002409D1C4|nr:uncharacterized protein LOC129249827 isoform X3 [Anastrepha obliqua]
MENGEVVVQLLQSKTRVAPVKLLTIPKLELCASHLLAQLVDKVVKSLQGCVENIALWSDSTTVLAWIRAEPIRWTVFVANRVAEIQRLTNVSQWRYIPTSDNPADCATKGILPDNLSIHPLWWHGPEWLLQNESAWPSDIDYRKETTLEKRKVVNILHINSSSYPQILYKFSTLGKTISVTAYIFRFYYNATSQPRRFGNLTAAELKSAFNRLLYLSQRYEYHEEIKQLLQTGELQKSNPIKKLNPFICGEGFLRVGGRLQLADIPENMKHPFLLSKKNPLTLLLFTDAHTRTLHGGIQLMITFIRRNYWIPNARRIAETVLKRCLVCFRYTAKVAEQLMGQIPAVRLTPARPFLHSGVDFAGPIDVRQSSLRNARTSKGYICIFLCMVSKAVHLECVSSLSTEAFIAAFRRFISRRGKCTQLYLDCGTNFVGASSLLHTMHQRNTASIPEDLRACFASEGTTWNFIPPASPHFGGLWEAGVKSTKFHLKRVLEDRVLNFEELTTLLYQIEACLNSRPLCPLNEDEENCDALTPGHFLIGEPTLNIPDENLLDFATSGLSRWRMVERLKQHFWRRWYSEYLSRLQSRPKWTTTRINAKIGDLVLMYDERCPPGRWPLARIVEMHPGPDGLTRVVTLKCKGKFFKRPIRKICFLPNVNPSKLTEDRIVEGSNDTAVSRGTAIQPGDKPITSNGSAGNNSNFSV